MSKTKMRCITCGKWFQSANAKEVTCPDCVQKARKEKLAAKSTPPSGKTAGQGISGTGSTTRPTPPPPPKPKPSPGGTSHWFDSVQDVKVGEPDQPQRPKLPFSPAQRDNRSGSERMGNRGPGGYRDDRGPGGPGGYREGTNRGPGGYRDDRGNRGPGGYREDRGPGGYHEDRGPSGYRVGGGTGIGQRPRQPMEGGFNRGPRPGPGGGGDSHRERYPGGNRGGRPEQKVKKPKPTPPPRPKREKIPPPKPFVPTDEQIKQVEERYLELATPTEFDGIRTQISQELGIPKKSVKKIVKELRERQSIPSWWEMQTYKGDSEELAKIKAAYEPYLPLPHVGVHKTISDELALKPGIVYQAIKAIRLEMNLPQYNDPALHGLELRPKKKEAAATTGEDVPAAEVKTEPAASASDGASQNESATVTGETTDASNVAAAAGTVTGDAANEMAEADALANKTPGGASSTGSSSATAPATEEHAEGEPETSEPVVALSSDGSTSGEE